ncbi:MAG: hypothetical protein A2W25_12230 [candidate division Zixibacteria bacterium RBG_16_53_22]|nr:MAG: hypothetical protein A2W25_12230 [candidate division Zixibacteria bacterium RBG_16_53_22]
MLLRQHVDYVNELVRQSRDMSITMALVWRFHVAFVEPLLDELGLVLVRFAPDERDNPPEWLAKYLNDMNKLYEALPVV